MMAQADLDRTVMTPVCREYLIERHSISVTVKLTEGSKVEVIARKGRGKVVLTWEEWQALLECQEMTNTASQLLLGTLGLH